MNYDRNKLIFEKVQNITLADVMKFQEENIKNRVYTFCILGDENTLDLNAMANYGEIKRLTLTDLFGY